MTITAIERTALNTPSALASIPFNTLFTVIMLLAAAVVTLITALVTYVIIRYRGRPGDEPPEQLFGNRRLEITWTVAPSVLLAIVFYFTFQDLRASATPGAGVPAGKQPDIEVVGHQFWWEFRYPKYGFVTANEIHVPIGRPVLLTVTSADVQHDFWVPQLGQKMDLYPGKTNHVWLEARSPGDYQGACAEFCGPQHAWMRILAVAQTQSGFDGWARQQRAAARGPSGGLVGQGAGLFNQYPCGSCHYVAGTDANGRAAPDLTHFGSRRDIAAGVMENTPENLATYLNNPQAVKPGSLMPSFRLSPQEVRALTAYLESLK